MNSNNIVSRIGITPVGSSKYRLNRLRFHLLAYSVARKAQLEGLNGKFIIRCDDTNANNINRAFLDPYLEVLDSLGVKADLTPYDADATGKSLFQSERSDIYREYCAKLMNNKFAYIDDSSAIFFDTVKFFEEFEHSLVEGKMTADDMSMGKIKVDPRTPEKRGRSGLVPFPIMRANGDYLFNLCSPVDDAVMGVTHIVRDRLKLSLLPQQEMVKAALGLPHVSYLHVPLLVNNEGKRLIHDDYFGEATFQDFIDKGILPQALVSYLLSGFAGPSENHYESIDDFSRQVNFSKLHQSDSVFSRSVLDQHNRKSLGEVSEDEYRKAFWKYLGSQETDLEGALEDNKELLAIIVKARRKFSDAIQIVTSLQSVELKPPSIELIGPVKKIMDVFIEYQLNSGNHISFESYFIDAYEDRLKSLYLSKKEYYGSLRYILTGQEHGIDLREVIKYLVQKNQIPERFKQVRNFLD